MPALVQSRKTGAPVGTGLQACPKGGSSRRLTVLNTSSNMASVSLPVFVFWREGWYEGDQGGEGALEPVDQAVAEGGAGTHGGAPAGQHPEGGVEADAAKGDDGLQAGQGIELGGQPRQAVVDFRGKRLVVGRRAADGGRNVGPGEDQAVVGAGRGREIGEAGAVQGAHQEVARAVAREDAPGPVAAVGGRGQADDQEARAGVAEARHRAAPIGLVTVGSLLFGGDLRAVVPQAGASLAGGNLSLQFVDLAIC